MGPFYVIEIRQPPNCRSRPPPPSLCRSHARGRPGIGETQSIVAAPPQGDLASVGFEKAGIANQTGARGVVIGGRHSSVRNKRSS